VSTHRTDEFPDQPVGRPVIERLPVGLANGQWHLAFVCSGVDFLDGNQPRAVRFAAAASAQLRVSGGTWNTRAVVGEWPSRTIVSARRAGCPGELERGLHDSFDCVRCET
jgi:hypothetical protein